jgi:hypothetical protein
MKTYGGFEIKIHNSWSRQQMYVNDQLYSLVTLPSITIETDMEPVV